MNETLVFAIEEFSTFDGPGIRTSVFLKGCPLRCDWCHNPEGQHFENEILKAQSGCIGCLACLRAGEGKLDARSISVCPNRLLREAGMPYTPTALCEKLAGNFDILRLSGGGVTFSGGEPLAHPEFLEECLRLLDGQIHTAIQTSGYAASVFDRILPLADYFLFDIKLMNAEAHRFYTGVDNTSILHNFRALAASGKPFTVRTPLIPGVTDTEENLSAIAALLQENGVKQIELLPYNRAAGGKYAAIGRKYSPRFDESIPVTPHLEIFERRGIRAALL